MDLMPIKKNISLKSQAYESIKQAIYSNTLKPGDALTEEALSALLQISRTPIRSALQQLVYEKLAMKDSTGHIFVSTISEKDVQDITVMRSNLEPLAIDFISFPIEQENIDYLKQLYEEQLLVFNKNPDDNLKYSELDTAFHSTIASLSNNTILAETVQNINSLMIRINVLSGTLKVHKEKALQEHLAIIGFLESGQKSFAKLALTEHITNVSNRMFEE